MAGSKESFASLLGLKETLRIQSEERAKAAAEEEKRKKERQAKAHEFGNAMKKLGVKPVKLHNDVVHHEKAKPDPYPRQTKLDNEAVLTDSLSDHINADLYLDSDERLSYRAKNMAPDIPKKLRAGTWSIKGSLDLHGYTSDEARALLSVFITEQMKAGHRAVRIIHGQGFGSFQKKPVLKERVPGWLIQKKEVLAFVEAPSFDGGAGALYVLLAPL
ncbi:Smr/MutS family protein [uncultured Parasutterella sp.]|uniref:Smr/MutS family protein n=1 Tax=uncultured Parasutterella sp. TaxID=1263098 RepID=UPI002597BC4C|nr:Smr/MutS family protein [uncultured Parasutterella sp.]